MNSVKYDIDTGLLKLGECETNKLCLQEIEESLKMTELFKTLDVDYGAGRCFSSTPPPSSCVSVCVCVRVPLRSPPFSPFLSLTSKRQVASRIHPALVFDSARLAYSSTQYAVTAETKCWFTPIPTDSYWLDKLWGGKGSGFSVYKLLQKPE